MLRVFRSQNVMRTYVAFLFVLLFRSSEGMNAGEAVDALWTRAGIQDRAWP